MMQQFKLPSYPAKRKATKRRRVRFIKVQFALSDVENDKIKRIAEAQSLTRLKLIKLAVREYAQRHPIGQIRQVEAGQLDMFRDAVSIQTAIPLD